MAGGDYQAWDLSEGGVIRRYQNRRTGELKSAIYFGNPSQRDAIAAEIEKEPKPGYFYVDSGFVYVEMRAETFCRRFAPVEEYEGVI